MKELKEKILEGKRISPEEAIELYNWDFLELGKTADARRKMIFPSENVGYIVDRIINFTNVCEAKCGFCAFHARANQIEKYEMTIEDILRKIEELKIAGGTQAMLQGGLNPNYTLDTYLNFLRKIKERYPEIYIHSFSPAEIVYISKKNLISIEDTVKSLKDAGLDSVPGASDLLVDRIRSKVSPNKATVDEWRAVIRALARNDMKSSATMTYGMGETIAEQITHLSVIRDIQDENKNLRAFIPWSFSPAKTRMSQTPPASGYEYLRIAAIARIFLDNIIYLQAGWLTEGLKLAQVALTMGANDMGGVLMEEVVVKSTGIETKTNENEMIAIIKNAGKIPVQRDSDYIMIRTDL